MGEGDEFGGVVAPGEDSFGEGGFAAVAEEVGLGVLADEEGELAVGKVGEELVEPEISARFSWREVAAAWVAAGIAVAHGDDGDARLIVESVAVEVHPFAEPVATGVVPTEACRVDFCAGGLPDNEDTRGGVGAQGGVRSEGEVGAMAAGAHFGQEALEGLLYFGRSGYHGAVEWNKGGECSIPCRREGIMDIGDFFDSSGDMSMLWMDGFGPQPIRSHLPQRPPTSPEAHAEMRDLRAQIERLSLLNQAMWELLRERLHLTDADLEQLAEQIDMRDGIQDGKITPVAVRCPSCSRVCNARHAKCMYCGQLFEKPMFA